MNQIILATEDFQKFVNIVMIFRDICNDVDIRDGKIRQKSNDRLTIFNIDLSTMIPGISIPISNLKQKIELLKIFVGNDVTITDEEKSFTVADQYSSIKFEKSDLSYLDNIYIPDEEFSSFSNVSEEEKLIDFVLPKNITDRLKVIANAFNVAYVRINFNGEYASISTRSQSKEQFAEIMSGIETEKIISNSTNNVITPFTIDHDTETRLRMYTIQENVCMNVYDTTLNEIPMQIFTRTQLIGLSEEE